VLFLLGQISSGRAEEFLKLIDLQGRVIEAQVEAVADGKASIKRGDGKRFEIPISKFEFKTQHVLLNWSE